MSDTNKNDVYYFNKLKKSFERKVVKKVNILSGKYIKKIINNIFVLNGRSIVEISKKNNTICFKIDDINVFSTVNKFSNWSTVKSDYCRVCIHFKDGSALYLNDKEDTVTFEIENIYGL
jgi:hypothetical protein